MAFIDFADKHGIIILILPPYTTHRLQPLDVGMFQPLSTAYSLELETLMSESGGMVSISKKLFYLIFKRAWDISFTETAIQHAFEKPGIWPINRGPTIKKVTRPVPTLSDNLQIGLKTPLSTKAIRHFQIDFKISPTQAKIEKLFRANETLACKASILEHENRGLKNAVIIQKKIGKKNKPLNLCGDKSQGVECYSLSKVVQARVFHEEKEVQEAKETAEKEARKVQRAATALKNKEEKEAKAVASQLAKELKSQIPPTTPAPKALPKQKKPVAVKAPKTAPIIPKAKKALTTSKSTSKMSKASGEVAAEPRVASKVVVGENSRGRKIVLPLRYNR
jgi:hypothetical protein